MAPGHANWMLDSSRVGPLPRWDRARAANGALALRSATRYVPRGSPRAHARATAAHSCSRTSSRSPSCRSSWPARRLGLPIVAHVASWDHTVGKGVIAPFCDVYIVQNATMRDDLDPLPRDRPRANRGHRLAADRRLTRGSGRARTTRPSSASYGLDPALPLVARHGEHADERALRGSLRRARRSVVGGGGSRTHVAPVPAASARPRMARSGSRLRWRLRRRTSRRRASRTSRCSPRSSSTPTCVVANAGTILLDALVNDRPAVCVLYDEGAPPGESWAMKNVIGEHYRELAASGAFYRAERFEEVVAGIERALAAPGGAAPTRAAGSWRRSSARSTAGRARRRRDRRGGRPPAMRAGILRVSWPASRQPCTRRRRGSATRSEPATSERTRSRPRPTANGRTRRRMVAGARQRARHGPVVWVPVNARCRVVFGSDSIRLAPRSPGSRRSAHVARLPTGRPEKQRSPMESPPAARLEGSYALVEAATSLSRRSVSAPRSTRP